MARSIGVGRGALVPGKIMDKLHPKSASQTKYETDLFAKYTANKAKMASSRPTVRMSKAEAMLRLTGKKTPWAKPGLREAKAKGGGGRSAAAKKAWQTRKRGN